MRIQCPACGAEGRVPDQEGKRTVRCPQCEHMWEVGGEEGASPDRAPEAGRPPRRRRLSNRKGVGSFSATRVVGKSLSIWSKNLGPFALIAFVGYLPALVPTLWSLSQGIESIEEHEARSDWPTLLLGFLSTYLIAASVISGVFQVLRSGKVDIGKSMSVGVRRLFPTMGVAVVSILCMCLVGFPVMWVTFAVAEPQDTDAGPEGCLFALVALVSFVGMLYVYFGLWLATPATVVERTGVFASLRRSWRLSRGVRSSVWLAMFLLGVLAGIAMLVVKTALQFAPVPVQVLASEGLTLLLFSLQGVVACVAYHQLRVAREGIASEELAAIFD